MKGQINNITKSDNVLYQNDSKCCGCGVCAKICPRNAIEMVPGNLGSLYPNINIEKCVGCDLCIKSCAFKESVSQKTIAGFAVAYQDDNIIMESSSGAAFTAIAEKFVENGYLIVGCALDIVQDEVLIKHKSVMDKEKLFIFRGSKYVQSDIQECLSEMKNHFLSGGKVLFSGSPCQVATVKKMFSNYKNELVTIDIVCHGVPSGILFNQYIKYSSLTPKKILFRDKRYGWAPKGTILEENGSLIEFNKTNSSYYSLFMSSEIYRESCYSCPYAAVDMRPGDLTLGDFWGIKNAYPSLLQCNGGEFSKEKGISCVLANSSTGIEIIELIKGNCSIFEVEKQAIINGNPQLYKPSKYSKLRRRIIISYDKNGYEGIEKIYKKNELMQKIRLKLINMLPKKVIKILR